MDRTDFQIIRHMFPQGRGQFWGGRTIVDPRVTPREIAGHLGLSQVAIRARISKMHREGTIAGDEVWINPAALGVRVGRTLLSLRDRVAVGPILTRLGEVEGILAARHAIVNARPVIWATYVHDAPATTARRVRQIRRICGSPAVRLLEDVWTRPIARKLRSEDWQVIAALRSDPTRSLTEHARVAGLSTKTFTRHYHALLDGQAIYWTRRFENVHFPAVAFKLYLRSESGRPRVARLLDGLGVPWAPFAPSAFGEPPHGRAPSTGGLFYVGAPVAAIELRDRLRQLPGVGRIVQIMFGRAESYGRWYDTQIALRLLNGH